MAQPPKTPRPSLSPKFRTNPEKKQAPEPDEQNPETLSQEALAPEDAFVHTGASLVDWVVRHAIPIAGVLGACLLGAVGYSLYGSHQESVNQEVASEIYLATRDVTSPMGAPAPEEAAKLRESATRLEAIAAEHPGVPSAAIGALSAGDAYLKAGDASAALKVFMAQADTTTDPLLRSYALSGIAAAHAAAGNSDASIETLRKMSTELTGIWKESALMDLGRALEGANKGDEAAATYEKLLTDMPFSTFAEEARGRLAVVKPDSKLAAPPVKAEAPAGE